MKIALIFFEFLLFLVVPLLLLFKIVDIFEIWLLIFSALYPLVYLYFKKDFSYKSLLLLPNREQVKWVFYRFLFFGSLLILFVLLFFEEMLFSFVKEKPTLFIAVILFYPMLSVLPQEIIYRVFFFERYERFFKKASTFLLINTLLFAYMHIVFNNIYAPLLTLVGGAIFALNYHKHRNLLLVLLEHTLYGWLIFLLGIGRFFYIGG